MSKRSCSPPPEALPADFAWDLGPVPRLVLVHRHRGVEKDLGTALLFFGIVLVMIYIATERAVWVFLGLSMFAVGCVLAFNLFSHVQVRVNTWLDPLAELPNDPGYQLRTGLVGMTYGGIPGTGLGNGRPDLTPGRPVTSSSPRSVKNSAWSA